MKQLSLVVFLIAACVLPAATSGQCTIVDYGTERACSLTGVNGPCTIIVDRMSAATPPTIYVRRGSVVTLRVINASPLEQLELDETSINTQPPIDSVQALAPLLTTLGELALPIAPAAPGGVMHEMVAQGGTPPAAKTFEEIQKEQADLWSDIHTQTSLDADLRKRLADALAVLRILLVAPLNGCDPASQWSVAMGKRGEAESALLDTRSSIVGHVGSPDSGAGSFGGPLAAEASKLVAIQADIDRFTNIATVLQKQSDDEIADLKASNGDLQKKIADEEKTAHPDQRKIAGWKETVGAQTTKIGDQKAAAAAFAVEDSVEVGQLKASQGIVSDALTKAQAIVKTVLYPAEYRLQALADVLAASPGTPTSFPIRDLLAKDKNDQVEVFTLNAVNRLTDPAKTLTGAAAGDAYSQALGDSNVTSAPVKVAVMQATVQYVTQPEMEVTAGVLVPLRPYKSYTAVAQSPGSATLVVQETHTYTIVPTVDLNFRIGNDQFAGNKRYGWFGTVAVGYNPATTMVEFGVGPSVALKSMVFSFLVDIGRDTELANGFTTNAALPGVATVPETNGVWSFKPSIGFSIRLPFNSGGGH